MPEILYVAVDKEGHVLGSAHKGEGGILCVSMSRYHISGQFNLVPPTPDLLQALKKKPAHAD